MTSKIQVKIQEEVTSKIPKIQAKIQEEVTSKIQTNIKEEGTSLRYLQKFQEELTSSIYAQYFEFL